MRRRDLDRRSKDRGGLDPRDVNADTVLVLDLVPVHAGADIPVPDADLALDVHVSHHGPSVVSGQIRATWVPAGTPFGDEDEPRGAGSESVEAKPFVLSPAVRVTVPPPAASSARLHLWLVDHDGAVRARTFVDAAPIEAPNRRGARWE